VRLRREEIELARSSGYVADSVDPRETVRRAGLYNYFDPIPADDMLDWHTRVYVIWFCYIYENFHIIRKPLSAIEELIFEFRAPSVIDLPGRRLATLYAGTGHLDPLPTREADDTLQSLKPHYDLAISLLESGR
jgi:hypothetical protein